MALKFSVGLQGSYPVRQYIEMAQRIENYGFDEIHVYDDLMFKPTWPLLTLIGEHTIGSTGQPYFTKFENGIAVAIGSKRAYFPDGSQFEGVGIMPDIEVIPSAAELQAGRDPVLDKALEIAGQEE